MQRRLYALIFCTVGSINAMDTQKSDELMKQPRPQDARCTWKWISLTDDDCEYDAEKDIRDIELTKKMYASATDLLKQYAIKVNNMEIKEISKNLTRQRDADSSFALEISNYCVFESFEVYLHSPCGLLGVATGNLKSHCDLLWIDFQKSALKTGKPEESSDYGEITLKYPIYDIIEDQKSVITNTNN